MDTDNWELRQKHLSAARDADQAERRAMLNGTASVEDAGFDERISGETDDEAAQIGGDDPEWEKQDVEAERIVGGALEQIERRVETLGGRYPFILGDGGLVYRPSATGIYELCLAATLNPMAKAEGFPKPTVIFEWIARDALKLYLGPGAQAYRTGWPSTRLEKRPRGTLRLFAELRSQCDEFVWRPKEYLPAMPKPRHLKDIGLDVVAWKPFPDRRSCCLFALGQCACGWTDWETKFEDLSLKRLRNWFEGPTHVEPLRCFFVPFDIPNHAHLKEVAGYAGVPIDRTRLVLLAEENQAAINAIKGAALLDYHKAALAIADASLAG